MKQVTFPESTGRMPMNNLNEFIAAPLHPMASVGPSIVNIDRAAQQLKALRQANGLSQAEVAERCGWSISKVIRMEGGQNRPYFRDVDLLLDKYPIDDQAVPDREVLRANAHANWKASTSTAYDSILPRARKHYLGYEAVATRLGLFAQNVVPDFLQTSAYAFGADLVFHADRDTNEYGLAARLRIERAGYLLGKHGPPLEVVINEEALHRPESNPDSTGERDRYAQLRLIINGLKALNTAGQKNLVNDELNPNITIQIAPFSSAYHPLSEHSYGIVQIPDQSYPGIYTQNVAEVGESFAPNSDEPPMEREAFSQLLRRLPPPEDTNDILDGILAKIALLN